MCPGRLSEDMNVEKCLHLWKWLKKIADALDVSLDYLAGEAARTVDKQIMKLIQDIEELEPSIR